MSAIHQYIIDFARSAAPRGRILDYGCGAGEVVEAGRDIGLDFTGVDIFYGGNESIHAVRQKGLLGEAIQEIRDGRIPFPDGTFDLVVSNQVLEHVEDLDQVLREIARVLTPAGRFLCLFPTLDVWREGHCGVPFVHWLPKRSPLRYSYLLLMRSLGAGYFKEGKSRRQWSADWVQWLDQFTHYRTRSEVAAAMSRYFSAAEHVEADYVAYRLGRLGWPRILRIPRVIAGWFCRKLAGVVLVARSRS